MERLLGYRNHVPGHDVFCVQHGITSYSDRCNGLAELLEQSTCWNAAGIFSIRSPAIIACSPFSAAARSPGSAVEIDAETGCLLCRISLGQEAADHACQRIAGAARCHAGIARGIDEDPAVRRSDHGACSFEHESYLVLPGKSRGDADPVLLHSQPSEFPAAWPFPRDGAS